MVIRRRRAEPDRPASLYRDLVEDHDTSVLLVYRARLTGEPLQSWPEGEPIEVRGSALPGRGRPFGFRHDDRLRVHPDGRIERVEQTGWDPRIVE